LYVFLIKGGLVGGKCRTYSVMISAMKLRSKNVKERDYFTNVGIDGRIILN